MGATTMAAPYSLYFIYRFSDRVYLFLGAFMLFSSAFRKGAGYSYALNYITDEPYCPLTWHQGSRDRSAFV
jgi:hypothetical protein